MGGPIVRIGSTPEFSAAWDKIFGGDGPAKKSDKKAPAKKATAPKAKKAVAKKAAKKPAKKKGKKK